MRYFELALNMIFWILNCFDFQKVISRIIAETIYENFTTLVCFTPISFKVFIFLDSSVEDPTKRLIP